MKEVKLQIKKASVIQVPHGPDQVRLVVDRASPFPEAGYEATVAIDVAQGYGREWLRSQFGIELTAEHDKLGSNPDMSVYERNMEEDPCSYCGTPLDLNEIHPRNRKGEIFCDTNCRTRSKLR